MKTSKRKTLEAAGYRVGDAADFLELSPEERQLLDTRMALAQAIREQRQAAKLTQKELGKRLRTTQPRVAKIEQASPDVSLDQLVRAFTAVGGRLTITPNRARKNNSAKLELNLKKS